MEEASVLTPPLALYIPVRERGLRGRDRPRASPDRRPERGPLGPPRLCAEIPAVHRRLDRGGVPRPDLHRRVRRLGPRGRRRRHSTPRPRPPDRERPRALALREAHRPRAARRRRVRGLLGVALGPVGLLLAVPLTLCLAVAGRYVPSLAFLNVLLGDQPGLGPADRFFQRLVAQDEEEAASVAEDYLKARSLAEELYDGVMLPALRDAKQDRSAGILGEEAAARLRGSSTNSSRTWRRAMARCRRARNTPQELRPRPPRRRPRRRRHPSSTCPPATRATRSPARCWPTCSRATAFAWIGSRGVLSGEAVAEGSAAGQPSCASAAPASRDHARALPLQAASRTSPGPGDRRRHLGRDRDPVTQEARMHGWGAEHVVVRLARGGARSCARPQPMRPWWATLRPSAECACRARPASRA